MVVVRAAISHGWYYDRTASLRIARGDGCAQLGDALINGLIAALDQPVGVQAQHRAGREVQGAYLAALLAGHADEQIGGLRRLISRLARAGDDGRQAPGGADAYLVRDGLNIAHTTVAIASGSKSAHSSSSSGEWRNRGGHP